MISEVLDRSWHLVRARCRGATVSTISFNLRTIPEKWVPSFPFYT